MKSKRNGLGLALLALSLSFAGSLVRAEEPASSLQNAVFDPLAKVVQTIELRLAGVEASVMAFAGSFSSDHITAQRLCVSDGSGETCVTRAQLDALLKLQVQLGQAPAAADQPTVAAAEAPHTATETASATESVTATETVTTESPKPATESVEAVAADSPKPTIEADAPQTAATVVAVEQAKESEPAFTGSVAAVPPEPESKSVHEEVPAPERVE
jgi:hypothetical protein